MEILPAVPDDADAIAQVHVSTWQATYERIVPAEYLERLSVQARVAMWRDTISSGKSELLVAKDVDQIVGFASFGPSRDEGASSKDAEVWAIYVLPGHWAQDVGRQMWLRAQEILVAQGYQSVSLWVLAENARAIRFYLAAGFLPEPASAKEIVLGGKSLQEVRYVAALSGKDLG